MILNAKSVRVLVVIALVCGSPIAGLGQEKSSSDVAFERLRSLQGTWEAVVKGSSRKMSATYVLTGGGNVLMETMGGMSTAYHLDKGTLVLTHFCGAGNQPRMRVKSVQNGGQHIAFEMYDITNLADPNAYHSTSLDVLFLDDGKVELTYGGMTAGRKSTQTFQLLQRTQTTTIQ